MKKKAAEFQEAEFGDASRVEARWIEMLDEKLELEVNFLQWKVNEAIAAEEHFKASKHEDAMYLCRVL